MKTIFNFWKEDKQVFDTFFDSFRNFKSKRNEDIVLSEISIIVATNKWANKERIRVSIRPNYIIKPVFSAFLYLSITIATLFVPTYCYITHFFFLLSKIFKNIRIFNHSSFFRWLFSKIYEIAIIPAPFLVLNHYTVSFLFMCENNRQRTPGPHISKAFWTSLQLHNLDKYRNFAHQFFVTVKT